MLLGQCHLALMIHVLKLNQARAVRAIICGPNEERRHTKSHGRPKHTSLSLFISLQMNSLPKVNPRSCLVQKNVCGTSIGRVTWGTHCQERPFQIESRTKLVAS